MSLARRNIRVTHVITRLIVGGAQENTVATVLGLQQAAGWEVNLISGPPEPGQGSLAGEFSDRPASLVLMPSLVRPIQPLVDFKALRELKAIFRSSRPHIVHTHSGKAGILGRWAAHLAQVPVIVHTIHGPSFGDWQNPVANLCFRQVERTAGKVTTHFIAVANAMVEQYRAAGIGTVPQYTRIFSGFPLEPYLRAKNDPELRARYGIPADALVIGKIARFFKLKGYEDLFEVMPAFLERFPEARFLLVGGGPSEERFKEVARSNPLLKGKAVFTGLVTPREIPALTGIMDLLVHLSLREGLPRALPQALAAGKPVVAYDCDGAGEVCLDGQTGLLVPARDKTALRGALERLAADAELRQRLGAKGREYVIERFPVDRMVRSIGELYERLISQSDLDCARAA